MSKIGKVSEEAWPKKLLFVISSLKGGGAERVLANIINNLDKNKYQISLAVFNKEGPHLGTINKQIKVVDFKKRNKLDFVKMIVKLKDLIKKENPDFLVSFLAYPNIISFFARSLSKSKCKVVMSERGYRVYTRVRFGLRLINKMLIQYVYRQAYRIIVVSKGIKSLLVTDLKIPPQIITIIHNPLLIDQINKLKGKKVEHYFFKEKPKKPIIISVGSLIRVKRQDILLKAFFLARQKEEALLLVLGKGHLLDKLKNVARELGISNYVNFIGFQNNPYKWMFRSDIFVLSSESEGFPSVLLEALACEVPVISTDCASGPGEIIQDSISGKLVPVNDPIKLAEAMVELIRDDGLCRKFKRVGIKRAEDFKVEKIITEYEKIFCIS
ncbi:MAG: glycosyltransferase [Candidatus Omnitrophica bacterium]|nr:glycosyltransferase [Candidatus Omnitrophota bacterium]